MKYEIEPVTDHKCTLGEGPVWDHRRQEILWLDIVKGDIHQYHPETKRFTTFAAGEMIGSIGFAGTRLVAAMQTGFSFIDLNNKSIERITNPEQHITGNRFNDGKCDPMGRFWAGTMSVTENHGAGNLYVLDRDLSVSTKIKGVTVSNGLAWSLDQKTLYYIDSPTLQVRSFSYEKETGSISGEEIIIKMDKGEGFPDGMTIDNQGMLWIAHWGGWKIARWDPFTGKKLMQIDLPVSQVTSCTFAGKDFSDLYVTSASIRLTPQQLQNEPLAGSLFIIKGTGYTGMPAFEFNQQTYSQKASTQSLM